MKGLAIHLGRRLVGAIIMILVVASFTFYLVHLMPGNPVQAQYEKLIMHGETATQAMDQVRVMYGFIPHTSLGVQYLQYMWNLMHLNLGQSISYTGVPVLHLILSAAPWTLVLGVSGLLVSFIIGVAAGVLAAVKRASPAGNFLTITGSMLHGIPQFVMALFLAYMLTTVWPIFPFGAPYNAMYTPGLNFPFLASLARHAVLPLAAYAISSYGGFMLTMKASVVSVLGDDFILASELRGIKPSIRLGYIARNAILPLFTIFTLSIAFVFGGALFIETIFDYPGLGYLIINAVGNTDWPLMTGAFLLITTAVIIANIFADLLYTVVDPRIRR